MDVKAPSRIVLAVNMVPAKKLLSVFTFQTKTLSELLKAKERITLDLNYLLLGAMRTPFPSILKIAC